MPTAAEVLNWASMTPMVNELLAPNTFLADSLYSDHEPQGTESIDFSVASRARKVAPFVKAGAEAIMVESYGAVTNTVTAPNIRIKINVKPTVLTERQPGTIISIPQNQQISEIERHIVRQGQILKDDIANAWEYLCAMSLQGTLSWSVTDEETFTIIFPRSSANNITLSTFWNDGTPANVRLYADVHAVKRVLGNNGFETTDAILGSEAADAFIALVEAGLLKPLDIRNVAGGSVSLVNQFTESGAMYLGTVAGVNFWEYSRTAEVDGTATNLIRPKYAEFVSRRPNAERKLYFGAILDMEAFKTRRFVGEIFSKGWDKQDPSCIVMLANSRPAPVPRKVDASVSVKVVSG